MAEYTFWRLYADPTPYTIPTLVKYEADTLRDAVKQFCREYGFRIVEATATEIWIEDRHGANVQYSIG